MSLQTFLLIHSIIAIVWILIGFFLDRAFDKREGNKFNILIFVQDEWAPIIVAIFWLPYLIMLALGIIAGWIIFKLLIRQTT